MGVCVSQPSGIHATAVRTPSSLSGHTKERTLLDSTTATNNVTAPATSVSPRKQPRRSDGVGVAAPAVIPVAGGGTPVAPVLINTGNSFGRTLQRPDGAATTQLPMRASAHSSPCSTSLSVSAEGPFTGYNPSAWYSSPSVNWSDGGFDGQGNSNNTNSSNGAPTNKCGGQAHRKSASIGVLERISKERNSRGSISINRSEDYLPQSKEAAASNDGTRKSLTARTRRLSSKLNDIPLKLNRFLARGDEEEMAPYLRRVFEAVDTHKQGSVSIGEIARQIFPDNERESISTTLRAADTTDQGVITVEQFIKFFVHLSGNNCMGPEVDLETGSGEMGVSTTDTVSEAGAASSSSSHGDLSVSATSGDLKKGLSPSLSHTDSRDSHVPHPHAASLPQPGSARKSVLGLRDIRLGFLTGQSERIKCIAMSADPRLYAVAHRHDSVAHIYTGDGKEVRRLNGHADSLLGIAFSPDRKYIATVSRDKLLVVWDCTVGLECHSVEHPGIVTAVAFAFDGKNVYTGCQDNLTRKISFPKGRLRASIPDLPNAEGGVIVSVAAQHTRNGLVVFSRSCDEHAYVAQADNLSLCMQLNGHETLVWQTAFSSNDDYILTCCERKIIVWRTVDFSPVGDYDASIGAGPANAGGCGGDVETLLWTTAIFGPAMCKDLLFAFNTQNEMLVLDLLEPEEGPIMDLQLRSSVYAAATSERSRSIVCGDDLGNVYQLELS